MLTRTSLVALLGGLTVAAARPLAHRDSSEDSLKPSSPVSHVNGRSFNRFVDIWLENVVSTLSSHQHTIMTV